MSKLAWFALVALATAGAVGATVDSIDAIFGRCLVGVFFGLAFGSLAFSEKTQPNSKYIAGGAFTIGYQAGAGLFVWLSNTAGLSTWLVMALVGSAMAWSIVRD